MSDSLILRIGTYVRFRADPKKVRVALRKVGEEPYHYWECRITSLINGDRCQAQAGKPDEAATRALQFASEHVRMPGINLEGHWAYPHPWGARP